jgi:sodium-dependent dicarboxylate transporter 2/3/5
LVLVGVVKESYGIEISFLQWFMFGFPLSLVLLFISWVYLTKFAFKFEQKKFPGGVEEINEQLKKLGPLGYEEKWILVVFVVTALAWITRSFLITPYFPAIDDSLIALLSCITLFLLPSKNKSIPLLNWQDTLHLPWGILLLFGGGMALAVGFESSGLAVWIGEHLKALQTIPLLVLLLLLIAAVNFLTEITSNLATTAMLLPILVSIASAIDVNPYFLLVGATIAASCAFMLPVATPPNAVVFGSGYLKIEDMVKAGFWLNILSIIIVTAFVYFILPLLWDFSTIS